MPAMERVCSRVPSASHSQSFQSHEKWRSTSSLRWKKSSVGKEPLRQSPLDSCWNRGKSLRQVDSRPCSWSRSTKLCQNGKKKNESRSTSG
jgi:hypothetical protein